MDSNNIYVSEIGILVQYKNQDKLYDIMRDEYMTDNKTLNKLGFYEYVK